MWFYDKLLVTNYKDKTPLGFLAKLSFICRHNLVRCRFYAYIIHMSVFSG